MTSFLDSLMIFAACGIPFIAGFTFLAGLCVKEWRPAIAGGLIGAILIGFVVTACVGGIFHSDGMGAGFGRGVAIVAIGLYACCGFVFGVGVFACLSPRRRVIGAILLLIGLLLPVGLPFRAREKRLTEERRWVDKQETERRNPHALVNDIDLPDEEDSGYRIRYVDNHAVIRASNAVFNVTPYVVLSPGKHWLTVKADTPKGNKLNLSIIGTQHAEVEAGHFYKLQVTNGKAILVEVNKISETNQTSVLIKP